MIDLQQIRDDLQTRNVIAYYTRILEPAHAVRVIEVCDGERVVDSVTVESEERFPTIKALFGLRKRYKIEGFEE